MPRSGNIIYSISGAPIGASRGEWSSSSAYYAGDWVTVVGAVYVATGTSLAGSAAPTSGGNWTLLLATPLIATSNLQDVVNKPQARANLGAAALVTIYQATGSLTGAGGTWFRFDNAAANSNPTITLPTGQNIGTYMIIEATPPVATVSYAAGAGDTIEGLTAAQVLQPNEYVELTYQVSNNTWYRRRHLWTPVAGTNVRRDGNGRAQVANPAAAQDIATKAYVDANAGGTVSYASLAKFGVD